MPSILVTGGAGFIGSNFVHYTLEKHPEYSLTILDDLTYAGNLRNLNQAIKKITFVKGSICDKNLVDKLVAQTDIVVNFAAEIHVDRSIKDPSPFIATNILGAYVLLESIKKHDKRLHHISTDEVYGDLSTTKRQCFSETSPYRPTSPYSATKASADMLIRSWIHTYGIQATISNCSNNFGPRQYPDAFIAKQITRILNNKKPVIYGTGEQVRQWFYVKDHCSAIHAILKKGTSGESYNIGSEMVLSISDLLQVILSHCNKPADYVEYANIRPTDDLAYVLDYSKIQEELSWQPSYSNIDTSIQETIDWYRNNNSSFLPKD